MVTVENHECFFDDVFPSVQVKITPLGLLPLVQKLY